MNTTAGNKMREFELLRVSLNADADYETARTILTALLKGKAIGCIGSRREITPRGFDLVIIDLYDIGMASFGNRLAHGFRKLLAACGYMRMHLVLPRPLKLQFTSFKVDRALKRSAGLFPGQ
jgi:hypothetical protein